MPQPAELLACWMTPQGRGAVATIGVQGNISLIDRYFRPVNKRLALSQELNRVCFGYWGVDTQEEIVVVRVDEDAMELHCHGGIAAAERILRDLNECGGTVVDQETWSRMTLSGIEAECQVVLTRTTTRRTAHHALRQTTLFPQAVRSLVSLAPLKALAVIDQMLEDGKTARHLLEPWQIVVCGRPNVGKSSLINALMGFERTVVFDQPGTTRDVVTAETAFQGWPVVLSDTAGLRDTDSSLEAAGIERAKARLQQADFILIVLDAHAGIQEDDQELMEAYPGALAVWNKCDLAPDQTVPEGVLPVSALTGSGLDDLVEHIFRRLVPVDLPADRGFPVHPGQISQLLTLRDLLVRQRYDAFQQHVLNWCQNPGDKG